MTASTNEQQQQDRQPVVELIGQILEARRTHYQLDQNRRLEAQRRRITPRTPIASNINEECPLEMYHGIVNWHYRPDHELHRMARMEAGELDAQRIKRLLRAWGFKVILDEAAVAIKDRKGRDAYRGKIDGAIQTTSGIIPYEAKCYHPNLHGRIDHIEDFARSEWTRKAPRQLIMYLLSEGKPAGFFILYCLGDMRLIPIYLDDHLADAERWLRLSEQVADAVAAKKPPGFAHDLVTCKTCWAFGRCCNPPIDTQGAEMITDPETVDCMEEVHATHDAAKRYEKAWDRIKVIMKAAKVERAIIGRFAMRAKISDRKAYHVPARDVPEGTTTRVTYTCIDDAGKEG